MPYPSSIATLAQGRRRRGLGDAAGAAVGTAILGPGVGTAIGGSLLNPTSWFGGGANPNERPQHKALITLLLAAGDQAGLEHIVTALFAGRTQNLYPTATLNHARSALAQVASVAPSPLAILQPLKAAWDASIVSDPGTGNVPWTASDGSGSGAHDWEISRANLALARAAVIGSSLAPSPNVTDVLPQTVIDGLRQLASGLLPSGSIPSNPAYGPQPAVAGAGPNLGLLLGGGLLVGLLLMKKRGR